MRTVTSKDGTTIAFDQSGKGPALILVGGAFEQRAMDSETALAYDAAVLAEEATVPTERAARGAVPTLIMDGAASFPFMHSTATALADAIPNAQHRTLEGQPHEVAAEAIAPVLVEFFNG